MENSLDLTALTYRGTVYPWQCDHMGHMNVMWYTGKFDEATWQLFSSLGLTPSRLRQENAGMVAVEQHLHYKREVHAGDVLSIHSSVLELKDKSLRFFHEMRNDETGELAATSLLVGLHLDTLLRKARSLPADVREKAAARLQGSTPASAGAC
ncbi:acyl-CoA thioesterase [Pseudomonas sp. CrR25]|nr:acyl-CoA thioesterase [Pseudomonas sp. CrR25]